MEKCANLLATPGEEGDNEQNIDIQQKWADLLAIESTEDESSDSEDDNDKIMEQMLANLNQISEDTTKRRTSIEKGFKEIQIRLDSNKENLDKVKTQIEKVTDVLHKLKDANTSNIKVQMRDWSEEVEEEINNEAKIIMQDCNDKITDLENAMAAGFKDLKH